MLEVVNLSPACFHLLRTEVISSVGPFDAPVSWFRISPASEERPAIVRKRGLAHTGAGLVEEAGRLLQVHVFAMQPFVPHCQPRLRHHEAGVGGQAVPIAKVAWSRSSPACLRQEEHVALAFASWTRLRPPSRRTCREHRRPRGRPVPASTTRWAVASRIRTSANYRFSCVASAPDKHDRAPGGRPSFFCPNAELSSLF